MFICARILEQRHAMQHTSRCLNYHVTEPTNGLLLHMVPDAPITNPTRTVGKLWGMRMEARVFVGGVTTLTPCALVYG